MTTLATPGTRSRRHRIVQYEIIDRSVKLMVLEVSPICMRRLVADKGGSINAMPAQVGSVCCATERRSCTTCRACRMSVPDLKMRTIDDSPAIDLERMVSRPGTLLRASSSWTVTRDSTADEAIPGTSV